MLQTDKIACVSRPVGKYGTSHRQDHVVRALLKGLRPPSLCWQVCLQKAPSSLFFSLSLSPAFPVLIVQERITLSCLLFSNRGTHSSPQTTQHEVADERSCVRIRCRCAWLEYHTVAMSYPGLQCLYICGLIRECMEQVLMAAPVEWTSCVITPSIFEDVPDLANADVATNGCWCK